MWTKQITKGVYRNCTGGKKEKGIVLGSVGTRVITFPFDRLFGNFNMNGNQIVVRAALWGIMTQTSGKFRCLIVWERHIGGFFLRKAQGVV